jgi:hypothetical protein
MLAEVTLARVAKVRSMYAREYCVIWKHDKKHTTHDHVSAQARLERARRVKAYRDEVGLSFMRLADGHPVGGRGHEGQVPAHAVVSRLEARRELAHHIAKDLQHARHARQCKDRRVLVMVRGGPRCTCVTSSAWSQ